MTRAAVVADLELIEKHDVATVAGEGTRRGCADDTGADDDDVRVETGHEADHSVRRSLPMRIELEAPVQSWQRALERLAQDARYRG